MFKQILSKKVFWKDEIGNDAVCENLFPLYSLFLANIHKR